MGKQLWKGFQVRSTRSDGQLQAWQIERTAARYQKKERGKAVLTPDLIITKYPTHQKLPEAHGQVCITMHGESENSLPVYKPAVTCDRDMEARQRLELGFGHARTHLSICIRSNERALDCMPPCV